MADCGVFDVKCHAAGWLDELSEGFFGELEQWVVRSAAEGMKLAVAGWIQVPTPTIAPGSGPVAYLTAYTYPIAFVLAVMSLLVAAGRLAWSQRGEDLMDLAKSLVTFIALTTLGVATVAALTAAGDSYSRWIVDASVGVGPGASDTQLGERILVTLGVAKLNPASSGLTGLVLVVGFGWLALTSIFLIFLTYLRGVLLLVLAGLLPVAAAAGINRSGRQMLNKYLAWILAWITFKPATATVLATGLWMVGTGNAIDVIGGIALLGMAVFMLPFLLRLFVPAAAAFAGGGGGSASAGAAAAGAVTLASMANRPRSGGESEASAMSLRDVSQGRPTGNTAPALPGPGAGYGAGKAVQPAAGGGGAAAGGAAGSTAGAGAAGGGAAAGGAAAAGGPAGMAAAAGVQAAGQVAQQGANAVRGAAGAATGEENSA